MSSDQSGKTFKRRSGTISSHFDPEDLTENDIEHIWKNLVKNTNYSPTKSSPKVKMMGSSVETTPTTGEVQNTLPYCSITDSSDVAPTEFRTDEKSYWDAMTALSLFWKLFNFKIIDLLSINSKA